MTPNAKDMNLLLRLPEEFRKEVGERLTERRRAICCLQVLTMKIVELLEESRMMVSRFQTCPIQDAVIETEYLLTYEEEREDQGALRGERPRSRD